MTKSKIEQWALEQMQGRNVRSWAPEDPDKKLAGEDTPLDLILIGARKMLEEAEKLNKSWGGDNLLEQLRELFEATPVMESGDWFLQCKKCGWKLDKNTASQNSCPDCGGNLTIFFR